MLRLLSLALVVVALPSGGAPVAVSVKARALQPGELVAVSIELESPAQAVRVRAFDRVTAAYQTGPLAWRALLGIDLDVSAGSYDIAVEADVPSGMSKASHAIDVKSKDFPTRTLTVDQAFVTPPESVQERIASEARLLQELWTKSAASRLWSGPFEAPVPQPSNSAFGSRSVFNGQARSPHSGADFSSPAGTPVMAPNTGRIALARDLYYSGNTVIIDHGLGLFSTLAHLSRIDVAEGASIARGAPVGLVGATGRVTGPHLHWAVRIGGARVDPLSVVAVAEEGKR
jgi:murein DD-endopeptidase MepM/ murein hydrolase activator NlpD